MILIVKGRSRMREHLFFSFLVVPGDGNVRFYYFSSFPHAGTPIFFVFACSRGREQAFFRNPGVPGVGNELFRSFGAPRKAVVPCINSFRCAPTVFLFMLPFASGVNMKGRCARLCFKTRRKAGHRHKNYTDNKSHYNYLPNKTNNPLALFVCLCRAR